MRHVASKVPSTAIAETAEIVAPETEVAAQPEAVKLDADDKSTKKSRRAARKAVAGGADPEDPNALIVEDAAAAAADGAGEDERLEQLYGEIAWPLGKIYGHTYDAFKLALTYVFTLFADFCCHTTDLVIVAVNPTQCFQHFPQFLPQLLRF